MQNVFATDLRGVSLEAEIRFTQYRLGHHFRHRFPVVGSCPYASATGCSGRAGACADASNPAGSQAAQLGRNSVICTGFTACCFAWRCGWQRLLSTCGTSRSEERWPSWPRNTHPTA